MIILAVRDLFMKIKIIDMAKSLETELLSRTNIDGVKEALEKHNISQIIVDLNLDKALDLVREIKKISSVKIVGFCGHTEIALIKESKSLGVEVYIRSIFFEKLNEIL